MAQSPMIPASGLERDYRQDEFPTRRDEFPTRQDEFPTACNHSGQTLHHGDRRIISEVHSDLPLHKSAIKARSRVCGLRISTFLLVVTVVVLLLFSGIGAGILDSRAASSEKKGCVLSSSINEQVCITVPGSLGDAIEAACPALS